jgi:hypothetical protein
MEAPEVAATVDPAGLATVDPAVATTAVLADLVADTCPTPVPSWDRHFPWGFCSWVPERRFSPLRASSQ